MIREEVRELVTIGPLPDSETAANDLVKVEAYQGLLDAISTPVSDDEAVALVALFGPDDCFGLAWTLVHLIESAPGWPLLDRIPAVDNQWLELLRDRSSRGL